LLDKDGNVIGEDGSLSVPVDALDARLMSEGSYCSRLSDSDRQKLRAVVKRVHLKNYPTEMITDYEADKMIEAIGPKTAEYLIKRHIEGATK